MSTKLTLRMDAELVKTAKAEAKRRGKSVSQMVGEFFSTLASSRHPRTESPPITASLTGVLAGRGISEEDYRTHMREKHG